MSDESLREYKVCGLRARGVFGRDPLPTLQVGSEVYGSRERSAEGQQGSRVIAVALADLRKSQADIFVPQVRVLAHEVGHQLHTLRIVNND